MGGIYLKKSDWLAIPNLLSLLRLALIPYFIYYYMEAQSQADYFWAAFIVLFSGLTDYLDGVIARKFDMITELGKSLDPAADKLTQLAIVICLVMTWRYMWILLTLFVIKEVGLIICNFILLKRNIIMDGAKWYGKVATFTFYGCALFLVAFPTMNPTVAYTLMFITGVMLLMAFVMYTRWFFIQYKLSENK